MGKIDHSEDDHGDLSRREFVRLVALGVGSSVLAGCGLKGREVGGGARRTLILGFDGLDPYLIRNWIAAGELPNFAKLQQQGGFRQLRSSRPPHSPVAWSNFITGMDPGGHGIYDFIHRDPASYGPHLSTSTTEPAERTISLGNWSIPLSGGQVKLWRKGPAFWKILEEHSIPTTIYRIPANFPPEQTSARTISGLGTPDLQGSYGHFSYFTENPPANAADISGGTVYTVEVRDGVVEGKLRGPRNDFRASQEQATVGFRVYVDATNPVACIDIQGEQILLNEGEWSDWVQVNFQFLPVLASCSGICRFYLKSAHPFALYVTPINIDPSDPALPISTPPNYANELQRNLGFFYTQGMAEDTKALSNGIFSDEEFLYQARMVFDERAEGLEYELSRFDDGVLFAYFSTSDLVVHMFWRATDPNHPLWTPKLAQEHGDVIKTVYQDLDRVLGRAMRVVGDDTLVMVVSDHGFSPYRRSFDLNSWLIAHGYLQADLHSEQAKLETADWSRSKAYGIGFNGLYVNEVGREAEGSVWPGPAKDKLLDELIARLAEVRDPATGKKVIHSVRKTSECYAQRPAPALAPDIIVGFERGYRGSWQTAIGDAAVDWITDNDSKWSGDQCLDPDVVPGVLFCNRSIQAQNPALYDIAPTILAEYGIEPPANMRGRPVLKQT